MQAEVPTITVCGSAAAEGVPAYFCNCRVCREAAERGGREIRGRTSYNFGGVLQIDFGPDSLQAFQRHRTALNAIRHILVTHAHTDHLSPRELSFHGGGYCLVPAHPGTITVHGTRPALDRIRSELRLPDGALRGGDLDRIGLELAPVRAFRRVEMPDIDATVLPLAADHDPGMEPVLYLVTLRGRTVLFGNDTGFLPDASWQELEAYAAEGRPRLDVAILDNTFGLRSCRRGHMGLDAVMETFGRLEALGIVDGRTTRVVNHFTHNANATHRELCEHYEPLGIVVGYDGLEL